MAKRKGLGKGLGAIFGDDVVEEQDQTSKTSKNVSRETSGKKSDDRDKEKEESGKEYMVKTSLIDPNESQPRKDFDKEEMAELTDSVRKYGVLQPLLVRKNGDRYEIIAGERRFRAAMAAGIKEVPVVIREYTPQQAMEIALIENVQREDLNPIEEAMAYQQLISEFGLTQEEIAERVSRNRATVTNSLRLLKLDKRVQDMLVRSEISGGHARALLGIESKEKQYQLAKKVAEEKLSVRETEKLVKNAGKAKKKKASKSVDEQVELAYRELEERMKEAIGTKVSINRRDNSKGKVEIEYYSEAELERIVELIESVR